MGHVVSKLRSAAYMYIGVILARINFRHESFNDDSEVSRSSAPEKSSSFLFYGMSNRLLEDPALG